MSSLTLATLLCCLWFSIAQVPTRLTLHIDDRELHTRAGYFNFRYFYRGGFPKVQQQTETYLCKESCDRTACELPGSVNITGAYCILWTVEERGSDETSYGTCRCTSRASSYCAAYTCDQTVTSYSSQCNEECYVSTTTFGKVKSCTCADFPSGGNATQHPFCRTYSCYGYGDKDIKDAEWSCYKSVSDLGQLGTTYTKDFCWFFGSDQNSKSVSEVKDCQCTQASDSMDFCLNWFCLDREENKWMWWSSLVASPIAAALNLWVPFVSYAYRDEVGVQVAVWIWALLTYLLIVMLGGIPSVIANTVALAAVAIFVQWLARRATYRRKQECIARGVALCPTCGSPWSGSAAGHISSNTLPSD